MVVVYDTEEQAQAIAGGSRSAPARGWACGSRQSKSLK
jgi:hypothetical protein